MIRFFDILFSFLGILFLSPVFLFLYIAIRLESKGGGFYKQLRVGRGGTDFYVYKFRSMRIGADKQGLITVGGRDPRITRIGYFIRKYKLDELPQLFNVLKGDMSLVGPRPEVRKYVELYTEEQRRVLSVRPGITDYASIEYVDEKELSLLNVENCITSYFEKHEDILQQLNDVSSNKIIVAISNCDVCFEKLNIANVSADIVEYIFDNCCFKLNDCMVRNVISYKKKNLLNMFENQPYSTIIKLEYQPLTEYVHENMKEYIEAVVLKKTIIEDEKEDIIDLLRRNLEESDLCASVIRLENFEIEKLADCLEQEIQNKRDKVKVVWNTLLEQNKIGISWENTMLYWKYYSISNYLKKFIEVNVDKLSVEKNNYVTDNFAKDIINAKFEDSVLKKLLPVLPMKTFDLDVEQLPENILAIMVECNYFGYTIEYYQSIAERNEDIAVEYIVKNQAEFYNSLEDFPMTKNVLERLLFEQKIPMDNREELFEKYAKTYMTERIALNMNAEGFKVTKTLFDIAWEILSENQKERLMIANLELLNVDDMEKCFGELSGQYSVLSERTKRCKVKLDNTENNRKLVNYLEKIGYITSSWEEKTDSNGQVIIIGCRIKQKR